MNVDQPMTLLFVCMTVKLIELISIRKLGVVSYIVSKKVVDSLCLSQVTVYIYVVEFPPLALGWCPFLQHICDDRKSFSQLPFVCVLAEYVLAYGSYLNK